MSNLELCKKNGVDVSTSYRVAKRLKISFADAVNLLKQKKRPFNKRIDGLDVNEYCSKYKCSIRQFYRYYEILQENL